MFSTEWEKHAIRTWLLQHCNNSVTYSQEVQAAKLCGRRLADASGDGHAAYEEALQDMPVQRLSPVAEGFHPIHITSPERRLCRTTFHTCLHAWNCIPQYGRCDTCAYHAGPTLSTKGPQSPSVESAGRAITGLEKPVPVIVLTSEQPHSPCMPGKIVPIQTLHLDLFRCRRRFPFQAT